MNAIQAALAVVTFYSFANLAEPQAPDALENYWSGEARGPLPTGTVEDQRSDDERVELRTTDPHDKHRIA